VAAGVLALYALTLAPTAAFWDASEYIATAHILGIPHPPGNPLFVALGKSWLLLLEPTGLSVAVRMNLFAAATSAAASGLFVLVAHRVLVEVVGPGWMARIGAGVSVLVGATAFTVWHQSTVNEKVYTVSVLVIALVSWLALRWRDRRDEPGSERLLLAAGYAMVLGSTNHLMSVLPAPALLVFVVAVGGGVLLRRRFWIRAVPLVALGLSFNLFLPIRAAQDPVINEAEPTCQEVGGTVVAIYTQGAAGCPALASALSREQYAKPPITERMAPLTSQMANWFQYFDWQWARGLAASELPGTRRLPVTLLFLVLGGVGLAATLRADRWGGAYLGLLLATLTLGLVVYLNFRQGYSLDPDAVTPLGREVRERDYFFIAGFLLWGVLAGIGLTWLWAAAARRLPARGAPLLTAPILGLALLPLVFNHGWASRSGETAAVDWAHALLSSVEPYGVLFTNGDNDTFPLWYLQEVEGYRRDVTVVVGQYLYTDWYPRQLQRLTSPERQRPFRPEQGVGLYRDRPPPPDPILEMAPAEMDRVRSGALAEDLTVSFPALAVSYPAGWELDRSHRLALAIIRDSIGERPIYFSSPLGMIQELGMGRWGVRHGLVARLDLRSLEGEPREAYVQGSPNLGEEWFHVPRSLELYQRVYRKDDFLTRDVWPDRATLNIPWQYYALALQLADVGSRKGLAPEEIAELQAHGRAFLTTARGGTEGTPREVEGVD
jgi:hypothetical protein